MTARRQPAFILPIDAYRSNLTQETDKEKEFHDELWTLDQAKCDNGCNEAVFHDIAGKHQSLNNTSLALHNMYEFFKDAGPNHEKKFFPKVRFFSVVASTEGLNIRIRRATREPSHISLIMPERPDYLIVFNGMNPHCISSLSH